MALLRRLVRGVRPKQRPALPSRFRDDLSSRPDVPRRRQFFADHILIHTHIPKTAGSTLSTGIQAIVGAVHATDLRGPRGTPLQELGQADMDDLHFVSGHVPYGIHRHFGRIPLYIAAVRDPVERAVSGYRFLSQSENHPAHETVKGLGFEDAYDALVSRPDKIGFNQQSHILLGHKQQTEIDRDALWQQTDTVYFLITPQPKATRTINCLRDAFGAPWSQPVNMTVSKGFETTPSAEMQARILADNPVDAELYDRVAGSYERRLQQACTYIAERCLKPMDPT